ncbi:response regulator transcription factor [bacterium]|nr:response regulator transcription factor [bacterium]
MDKKICIVDDDKKLVSLLSKYLRKNGFTSVSTIEPKDLLEMREIEHELFILDIMMPEIDGFEVCKAIRKKSDAYVIFLSAKSDSIDKIVGLEIGADDYIVKPFEPRELLARINSLFRRQNMQSKEKNVNSLGIMKFKEFKFDLDKQLLLRDDEETFLTTYEFLLLRYFCLNINIILSRKQILTYLESHDFISYGRSIDIGISRLRKKIEIDSKKPRILKTVWGRGYQFTVEHEET